MILPSPPLLLITDRRQARRPLPDVVAAAFAGGCRWVSLREKDLPDGDRLTLLRELRALGRRYGATVTVHADLAAARAADGVHLPSGGSVDAARRLLGEGALVGISTHSLEEAAAAARVGADYVTLSPIFASISKPDYGPALGLAALGDAARAIPIPIVALGGISAANAGSCIAAGAAGVAVMGTIMLASDPVTATVRLLDAIGTANDRKA